jgi:acyl-CoA synthetase (AMP-forming)/AMP-acid ligase II
MPAAVGQVSIARSEGGPLNPLSGMIWIADIPRIGAQVCPDRAAIVFPDGGLTVTYDALEAASNAFAAALRARGLGGADRIAYLGRNSDVFYPVLFGAIRADCVLVPINSRLTGPEIHQQLQDSRARLLICDSELQALAGQAVQGLASLPELLLIEAGDETGLRAELRRPAAVFPVPKVPEQVVLQLYTSGTTGRPKGVLISHQALSLSRHAELSTPQLGHLEQGCVIASPMPNFHIGGSSWVLMGLVRLGTVILTANPSPANLLELLQKHQARHIFIVPTVIRALVDEIRSRQLPAPRLTGIYYGAMPMSAALLRDSLEVFDCAFVHFYGMTENTGSATFLAPQDHDLACAERLKSVGRPYPGTSLEIRGPDRRVLRVGQAGEIWVNSPTLMLGYSNLPEATREALIEGWYATGDGGYLDVEGYLYLTDRIKDMIVSGGENVYPVEVEEALRRHPSVLDAAVVGKPDARWGEAVVAFVQLRPGAAASAQDVLLSARRHIAGYKCPKILYFVVELPRTAAGKVRRGELRAAAQSADPANP